MEQYIKEMFEQINKLYDIYGLNLSLALKYATEGYPNLSEAMFNEAKDVLEYIYHMIDGIYDNFNIRKDID